MRFFAIIAAFLLFFGSLSVSAFADTTNGYNDRERADRTPIVSCDTILKQKEWNGKSRLRKDTCYFVDTTVHVTKSTTLPETSMIVVENQGKLIVDENISLYVKGGIAVHSKADMVVKGRLILKSGSVSVINGDLLIDDKGRASIYGDVQVSDEGTIGMKGRAAVHKNGVVLNYGEVKKMSDPALLPDVTECGADEPKRYLIDEYSDYLDNKMTIYSWGDDDGLEIVKRTEKQELIRNFESIIYKYDGEFSGVDVWSLNDMYSFYIEVDGDPYKVYAGMNNYNWTTRNAEDDGGFETMKGSFYSSILGKGDKELFARIDPNSPLYVHPWNYEASASYDQPVYVMDQYENKFKYVLLNVVPEKIYWNYIDGFDPAVGEPLSILIPTVMYDTAINSDSLLIHLDDHSGRMEHTFSLLYGDPGTDTFDNYIGDTDWDVDNLFTFKDGVLTEYKPTEEMLEHFMYYEPTGSIMLDYGQSEFRYGMTVDEIDKFLDKTHQYRIKTEKEAEEVRNELGENYNVDCDYLSYAFFIEGAEMRVRVVTD